MDIAIIGFSFNLAGAKNVDQLSALLASGKDALTFSPDARPNDACWVNRAGYIDGEDEFDYSLFGLSLRDSMIIEPQQRLFVQQVWKALEFAGYNPKGIPHTVGVFSSSSDSHFTQYLPQSNLDLSRYEPFEIEVGANKEQQSLRTAFLFDFIGPAMGIQSACSSGLLTVHIAMQSLQSGDCEVAIVGGSSLPYPLHQGYYYRQGMNLSETGKISSFDRLADGMVPGFGAVVFVLKPYQRAIKDKDQIYARIRGSAVNNDGRHKSAYTAPSTAAIAKNITRALENSGVDKHAVHFVEAHGSGTIIGDVLEAAALRMVFNRHEKQKSVALSSIKAAVGHLDAAAGHAGLLKATLQIWQQRLFPAANFNILNDSISLNDSPLYVPKSAESQACLIGVVNSLGIGGTNCALVVDSANPSSSASEDTGEKQPIYIGAETRQRLDQLLQQLKFELADCSYTFTDICYTLSRRAYGKKYIILFYANNIEQFISLIDRTIGQEVNNINYNIDFSVFNGKAVCLKSSELDLNQKIILSSPKSSYPELDDLSHISSTLRNIWIDNLMVPEVNSNDSFIGLGGHSILVLSMLDDILKAFNVKLSLAWFDQNDTFSQQVAEIEHLIRKTSSHELIVQLHNVKQPPRCRVVLVHASISGAERYQQLAELLPDYIDVIAIDSYNLYSADKIQQLDGLVRLYAEKLLDAIEDKSVPHMIGGWSLGGMLARAITAKVSSRINVIGNILLDSARYATRYSAIFATENLHYFMDVNKFNSDRVKEMTSIATLNSLLNIESRMVKEFIDPDLTLPVLNIIATGVKKVLDKPLLREQFTALKHDNGWDLNGQISNEYIDTDHEGVINTSQVKLVSRIMTRFINKYV
jgi:3-oxoacyl-(acyl-carrier-protein) synthase/acyl carrier protein